MRRSQTPLDKMLPQTMTHPPLCFTDGYKHYMLSQFPELLCTFERFSSVHTIHHSIRLVANDFQTRSPFLPVLIFSNFFSISFLHASFVLHSSNFHKYLMNMLHTMLRYAMFSGNSSLGINLCYFFHICQTVLSLAFFIHTTKDQRKVANV